MPTHEGYLKIHRRFFEHFLWHEPRVYSRAEAWLDLIQSASYAAGPRLVNGLVMHLQRGSLIASVRWLCRRWGWSNTKVCLFLQVLRDEGMITTRQQHNTTVITLCNYQAFNPAASTEGEPSGKPVGDRESPQRASSSPEQGAMPSSVEPAQGPAAAPPPARARAHSCEEVVAYCVQIGLPGSDGVYLWETWQAGGWMRGRHPMRDWQAQTRAWRSAGYLPSQKQAALRPFRSPRLGPITATHDPTGRLAAQYRPTPETRLAA